MDIEEYTTLYKLLGKVKYMNLHNLRFGNLTKEYKLDCQNQIDAVDTILKDIPLD